MALNLSIIFVNSRWDRKEEKFRSLKAVESAIVKAPEGMRYAVVNDKKSGLVIAVYRYERHAKKITPKQWQDIESRNMYRKEVS